MIPVQIVIGLAHEGVPVAAIARATGTPSEDVWPVLRDAVTNGALTRLPRADWPPGLRQEDRAPALAPLRLDEIPIAMPSLQRAIGLTPQEARLVAALLIRREMSTSALHVVLSGPAPTTCRDLVKMTIFHARRKLRPIEIETVGSSGYALSRAAADAITARVAQFREAEGIV